MPLPAPVRQAVAKNRVISCAPVLTAVRRDAARVAVAITHNRSKVPELAYGRMVMVAVAVLNKYQLTHDAMCLLSHRPVL